MCLCFLFRDDDDEEEDDDDDEEEEEEETPVKARTFFEVQLHKC